MIDFEKWFSNQDFYMNMRFIHGDALFAKDGDVYRVLPVQIAYQAWQTARYKTKDEHIALTQEWHRKGWDDRQSEIDQLKALLNNMEQCYIEKKKQVDAVEHVLGCAMIGPKEVFQYAKRIGKALRGES